MQKRGYHDFPSKFFCLTVPRNFIGEHFGVSEEFFYRKFSCIEGGRHGFVENFLSHSTEKIRWGTIRCFKKFRVWKNFMHRKGLSLFSLETSLSHSAEKLRKGTILCFRNILARKKFYG